MRFAALSPGRAAICIALIAVPATLLAQADKTVPFKTGKFEAKTNDGDTCSATIGIGSSLQTLKTTQLFGASYKSKDCQIRLAIVDVKGPGKYGKGNIYNFSTNWGATQQPWNYNGRNDDCTFTFTKLDETGAAATITCSGTAPFKSATLTAAP